LRVADSGAKREEPLNPDKTIWTDEKKHSWEKSGTSSNENPMKNSRADQ